MKRREFIKRIVDIYDVESSVFDNADMYVAVHEIAYQQPYCFTKIVVELEDEDFFGFGFSKVCYPDEFDLQKGINITRDRALVNLAESLWHNADPSWITSFLYHEEGV